MTTSSITHTDSNTDKSLTASNNNNNNNEDVIKPSHLSRTIDSPAVSPPSGINSDPTADDEQGDWLQALKAEALVPLKADLAAWLNRPSVLGPLGLDADNFIDALDNGVIVCRLAELIRQRIEEARSGTSTCAGTATSSGY